MQDIGQITGATGESLCTYMKIYGTSCLHCGLGFSGPLQFLALGPPYNGLVHANCAPHFNYSNTVPQPHPRVTYPGNSSLFM